MKTENKPTLSLFQCENLRIGQRGIYQGSEPFAQRCKKLGVSAWIEKRATQITQADKNLRTFINIPVGYDLVYGITYRGADFDCGDMPRDLGKVVKGIEIATA